MLRKKARVCWELFFRVMRFSASGGEGSPEPDPLSATDVVVKLFGIPYRM